MVSKKFVVMVSVFLFAGLASASFLSVYGTVSGEVSVDPAVDFEEVQAEPSDNLSEYVLLENEADDSLHVSRLAVGEDTLVPRDDEKVNSGGHILVVEENAEINQTDFDDDEFIVASTGDSGITGGLANGGEYFSVSIDDSEVVFFDYESSCSPPGARDTETSCGDAKFEVLPGDSE